MKPRLLAIELWGLGDLVIATPFLHAASQRFDVTLLAKPYALDLRPRFWPHIKVHAFVAPWTAFHRKYHVWRWPWREMVRLRALRKARFDIGLSARWDPRDHALLWASGAKQRMGFPRIKSGFLLTHPLCRPSPTAHRYEHWRSLASMLGLDLPPEKECFPPRKHSTGRVLVHTGAGQPVRVWPLEKYRNLVQRLRAIKVPVCVACDPDQRTWWVDAGEPSVIVPRSVTQLLECFDQSAAFIGNDSGPAHLAAASGLPTLTLFGPQLPEWFAPLGPASTCIEGKPCPYKPCSDYCRFPLPYCLANVKEEEVWTRIRQFVQNALQIQTPAMPKPIQP